MTVAVSCNLSDGVILGVDSAVTVPAPGGVTKVYENAEKLFQIAGRPIGVAVYGLGALGTRTIGSYLREFQLKDPEGVVSGKTSMAAVTEALRIFFLERYMQEIAPQIEAAHGRSFAELTPDQIPILGLIVGGFSAESPLSEVHHIVVPTHAHEGSAQLSRGRGDFGANWFAMFEPIRRYTKGIDAGLIDQLLTWFQDLRGAPITPEEIQHVGSLLLPFEYQIPFAAMPLQEGLAYVRFLVEIVINHHRFSVGAPVVGGRAKIGRVSYTGTEFQILDSEVERRTK